MRIQPKGPDYLAVARLFEAVAGVLQAEGKPALASLPGKLRDLARQIREDAGGVASNPAAQGPRKPDAYLR